MLEYLIPAQYAQGSTLFGKVLRHLPPEQRVGASSLKIKSHAELMMSAITTFKDSFAASPISHSLLTVKECRGPLYAPLMQSELYDLQTISE
jgi:hypothetical protein